MSDDDLAGMRDLCGTLEDAMEIIAAFLGEAAQARIPSEATVDHAHHIMGELAQWRATLEDIVARDNDTEGMH